MATTEEQLEAVQAAIAKIESGAQSYGIAGRNIQRADLATLYAREKALKKTLYRQKRGTSFSYFVVGEG